MDYAIQILTALLDRYERLSRKPACAVTIEISNCCPAYRDHLSAEERNIDQAVTCLARLADDRRPPAAPRGTIQNSPSTWTTSQRYTPA